MAMDRARRGARRWRPATTRRSRAASNGSPACRAATAAGPPSMPTMSITTSTTFPSPIMARCSIRRPPMSAPAASACWPSSARRRPIPSCVAGTRLPRARADAGRQLVRPLGRQLHLRHVVGAVRARTPPASTARRPACAKAADWLIAIQNEDGGWGEDCTSYKLDYRGYEPAASTASQTAWALLGLMAAGEVDHPAVERGIAWLQQAPGRDGPVAAGCLYRRRLSRASSTCATTATRNTSRCGRWRAIATCGAPTAGASRYGM